MLLFLFGLLFFLYLIKVFFQLQLSTSVSIAYKSLHTHKAPADVRYTGMYLPPGYPPPSKQCLHKHACTRDTNRCTLHKHVFITSYPPPCRQCFYTNLHTHEAPADVDDIRYTSMYSPRGYPPPGRGNAYTNMHAQEAPVDAHYTSSTYLSFPTRLSAIIKQCLHKPAYT